MGRTPCCSGEHAALKRGPWTHEEDQKLKNFLLHQPSTSWRSLPQRAGLLRCGKSCRLRWMNYLRPDIRRGNFTEEEENRIIQLHAAIGNKWSVIACHLPGRTDNEIKNLWNTKLRKLLVIKGINPVTHQPLCNPLLADYVKQWVKSIENMLIVGLATSSSSATSLNPNTTGNNGNSNSTDTRPWMTLPPMQPATASDEKFQYQSPNIPNSCPGPSMMNSTGSFVVDENSRSGENFLDSLMFGEGSFLPGDLSDWLKENFGESTELVGNVGSQLASAAPAASGEGFMYWD